MHTASKTLLYHSHPLAYNVAEAPSHASCEPAPIQLQGSAPFDRLCKLLTDSSPTADQCSLVFGHLDHVQISGPTIVCVQQGWCVQQGPNRLVTWDPIKWPLCRWRSGRSVWCVCPIARAAGASKNQAYSGMQVSFLSNAGEPGVLTTRSKCNIGIQVVLGAGGTATEATSLRYAYASHADRDFLPPLEE